MSDRDDMRVTCSCLVTAELGLWSFCWFSTDILPRPPLLRLSGNLYQSCAGVRMKTRPKFGRALPQSLPRWCSAQALLRAWVPCDT